MRSPELAHVITFVCRYNSLPVISEDIHFLLPHFRKPTLFLLNKGGNLATWRWGVSFSFGVLKPRCQVSVLVWFHGCRKLGFSFGFSFAYAHLRFLGLSFIQENYLIVNTDYLCALLLSVFVMLR